MDATADKLAAARHEAGHLTVCLALDGMDCDACIGVQCDRWDGESHSLINVIDPPNARQIHGIAGITAELWAEHRRCTGTGVLEHYYRGALNRLKGTWHFSQPMKRKTPLS